MTENAFPLINLDSAIRSNAISPSGINISTDMRRRKIEPTPTDAFCRNEFPPVLRCPRMPTNYRINPLYRINLFLFIPGKKIPKHFDISAPFGNIDTVIPRKSDTAPFLEINNALHRNGSLPQKAAQAQHAY